MLFIALMPYPSVKTFQYNGAITADLQVLHAFNLLLHVKWPDFEPILVTSAFRRG